MLKCNFRGPFFWSTLSRASFLAVFLSVTISPAVVWGQTFGPNNPATTANNAAIGTNNWTNPGNSAATDNAYGTVTTRGFTRYLSATNFNFSIPLTSTINGIQVEVERSTPTVTAVTLGDAWSTGLTKTITAGTDRCLVVIASTENGDGATDVTALTYGGQAMTNVGEFTVGAAGGFTNRIEVWILLEPGIAAAGSTTLVPTLSASSYVENMEGYSSAVFRFVDQYNPVFQIRNSTVTGDVVPYQLASALNTLVGSMSVSAIACGNNTIPGVANGGTNTFTINSGFTEGTDMYFSNPGFATSGFCLQTANKSSAAVATEQPTFTFNGDANRQVAVAFTLRAATGLDNNVRLTRAGGAVGSNYAQGTTPWPTADSYATYGGSTDLWGTTWTPAQINNPNFGVLFSAIHQSGTLQVDHIRITVYTTAVLPVTLVSFTGRLVEKDVVLNWRTATEINNDYFTVEYSGDGINFIEIDSVKGAGNSNVPINYSTTYKNIFYKNSYFRLKQTDFDGQYTYSDVIYLDTSPLVNDLSIFPNPASSTINILNSTEDNVSVRLISQTGVTMMELHPENQFNEYDVSSLPQGLYVVEILQGPRRSFQKLLVDH